MMLEVLLENTVVFKGSSVEVWDYVHKEFYRKTQKVYIRDKNLVVKHWQLWWKENK